jgi:amino acid transporter
LKKKHTSIEPGGSLQKVLGFWSLFAVGIGCVTAQSSFVSLLNGAGSGGGAFFIAIAIAFFLGLCYCVSFLELSLMMPEAGGPGRYTSVSAGNFISIGVVLGGYIAVQPFAAPAELMLLEHVVDVVYPGTFSHLGIMLVVLFTVFNFFGINIFSSVQNIMVYTLLVALLLIGFVGLGGGVGRGIDLAGMGEQFKGSGTSVLTLVVLALWSFGGLDYMVPLVEEAKNPVRDLPRAMLGALVMLLVLYSLLSFGAIRHIPKDLLVGSDIPHWLLVESLFGRSAGFIVVVFALTATSSIVNSVIASLPRLLYGMAQRGQVPLVFARVHPRWGTPWVGILFIFLLMAIPMIVYARQKDLIMTLLLSAATFFMVGYIVAHVNVILLRRRYPDHPRPFKTPWYPLPQIVGIIGMAYAIWDNSPSAEMSKKVYLNSAIIFFTISAYAFFWVKYKMKKGILETEHIEEVTSNRVERDMPGS